MVESDGLTFLQRAGQVVLDKLEDYEVCASIMDTVIDSGMDIGLESAQKMATAAEGYPFMVQLVGYHTWQNAKRRGVRSIGDSDVGNGVRAAREHFESMVIEPALRRLPAGQIAYLLAMSQGGGDVVKTGQISEALGRNSKEVAPYRRRLIDSGVIEPRGYGKVSFAIPYMREYLHAHEEQLRTRLSEE